MERSRWDILIRNQLTLAMQHRPMRMGVLRIYIELRDENYPGSNYNLIYYPERDLFAGKYFQAVERVTYDVGFTRVK